MASGRVRRTCYSLLAGPVVISLVLPLQPAKADPPDWAPAHGWRHHHGDDDEQQVIIVQQPAPVYAAPPPAAYAPPPPPPACSGLQTSEVMGALAGAAGGGLVGSKFGKGSGKLATTGMGVAAGALVGDRVGRSLGGC